MKREQDVQVFTVSVAEASDDLAARIIAKVPEGHRIVSAAPVMGKDGGGEDAVIIILVSETDTAE